MGKILGENILSANYMGEERKKMFESWKANMKKETEIICGNHELPIVFPNIDNPIPTNNRKKV
jgi:hypothetical protein